MASIEYTQTGGNFGDNPSFTDGFIVQHEGIGDQGWFYQTREAANAAARSNIANGYAVRIIPATRVTSPAIEDRLR